MKKNYMKTEQQRLAKLFLILCVIFSVGMVLGLAGYLAKNKSVKSILPQVLVVPEPAATPLVKDETSDWKTYSNENWNIKLPLTYERINTNKEDITDDFIKKTFQGIKIKDLSLEGAFSGIEFKKIQKKSANIPFFNYVQSLAAKSKSYDEYFQDYIQSIEDPEEIKIDSIPVIKTKLFVFEDCSRYAYWFEKSATEYIEIDITKCYENGGPFGIEGLTNKQRLAIEKEVQQILSTFEFIKKDGTDNLSKNNPIISLPFHNGNKILQVYGTQASSLYSYICTSGDEPYCIAKGLSVFDTTLSLTIYNMEDKSLVFLGDVGMISYTGNSGGLFVPFAITKDNTKIILEANMDDPGAGGGSVDYGYAMISIKPAPSKDWAINDFQPVANLSTVGFPFAGDFVHFYDSYGKVVYIDEGNKSPHYDPPPYESNDGAIMFRNLATDEIKKLLEETDTSYEITELDEKNGVLKFKAIKHIYSKGCDREIPVSYSDCVKNSMTERTISLP